MATLSEVSELIVDCEHKTAPTTKAGYPSIRTSNIGRGRLKLDGVYRVSEETYRKWTRRAVPREGDIILAREAPVGNAAIIPKGLRVCLGQRTVLIRPDRGRVDPDYLTYLLLTDEVQGRFHGLTAGATVPHLNVGDIREFELPTLPPLSVQVRVGRRVADIDDLIENNTRRIEILEEMAHAIYREWFVNFRFPGHEDVEMVESELGPVPEGWEVRSIGEELVTLGGGTPSTKKDEYWVAGDITWFTPSDLTAADRMFISQSSRTINDLGLQKSSAKLFPPYSVMMTSRATVGVVSINTTEACTNQGFITVIPNDRVSAYQIYFWIKQSLPEILNLASGATFKEINKTNFRSLFIPIPPLEVSGNFESLIGPIGQLTQNLQQQVSLLRETRDLLLPKLVSGEISVEDLDSTLEEAVA